MSDFENYPDHAYRISIEIEGKLVALGLDWRDEQSMREVAREALTIKGDHQQLARIEDPLLRRARMELHGLIGLMLQTMTESAQVGYEVHGRDSWKALARALWAEKEVLDSNNVSRGTE